MIQNDEQLKQTQEALAIVEHALAVLRREIPVNSRRYALMAEGNIEDIWRLRRQIDEYLGLNFTPAPEPFAHEKAKVE